MSRIWKTPLSLTWESLVPLTQERKLTLVKNCLPMQETGVQSLGGGEPLEKEMAIHSSILAWWIPWMEEPGGLQSMGSSRVGQDLETKAKPTTATKKNKQKRRASGRVPGIWAAKQLTEPETKAISMSVKHSRLKGAQRDGVEKENISSCERVSPLPAGILNLAPVKESLAAYFL